MRLKKWEKFLDLPSMLPDTRQWKLDTEAQGALRMEFANKGKYLAVACTMAQKSKTIIKVFDVTASRVEETCKLVLRGHHDLIHDMNWSADDKFLVTASADGSAKVWDLTQKEVANQRERMNYTENDSTFFLTQLLHPSYVYAAKIMKEE